MRMIHGKLRWVKAKESIRDFAAALLGATRPANVRSKKRKRSVGKAEAEKKGKQLAKKLGDGFRLACPTQQSKLIGCHLKTWRGTSYFAELEARNAAFLPKRRQKGKTMSRAAENYTDKVAEETAVGGGEGLSELIDSDEDPTLSALLAEYDTDTKRSSCDDDATGRRFASHHHKRV